MIKIKKILYKFIGLLGVLGIVLMVQGAAVSGSFYYTDNYDRCRNRDGNFADISDSGDELKAEFYNFRMMVLSEDNLGSALVSQPATEHTNQVVHWLNRVYFYSRYLMIGGLLLGIFAFLCLYRRKCYQLFRIGALLTLILPFFILAVAMVTRFSAVKNVISCVFFSDYKAVFYDDNAFVSILPRGLLLGYAVSYIILWLGGCAAAAFIYRTKRKHRSPYRF